LFERCGDSNSVELRGCTRNRFTAQVFLLEDMTLRLVENISRMPKHTKKSGKRPKGSDDEFAIDLVDSSIPKAPRHSITIHDSDDDVGGAQSAMSVVRRIKTVKKDKGKVGKGDVEAPTKATVVPDEQGPSGGSMFA
jgi:hypothetical protein